MNSKLVAVALKPVSSISGGLDAAAMYFSGTLH
jgi:hypothetical protein